MEYLPLSNLSMWNSERLVTRIARSRLCRGDIALRYQFPYPKLFPGCRPWRILFGFRTNAILVLHVKSIVSWETRKRPNLRRSVNQRLGQENGMASYILYVVRLMWRVGIIQWNWAIRSKNHWVGSPKNRRTSEILPQRPRSTR